MHVRPILGACLSRPISRISVDRLNLATDGLEYTHRLGLGVAGPETGSQTL